MKVRHVRESYFGPRGPAITIVSTLRYDNENSKYPSALEFALAVCSPYDNFSKKDGVSLAVKRIDNRDERYYRSIKLDCHRKLPAVDLEYLIDATISTMNIPDFAFRLMREYCDCFR